MPKKGGKKRAKKRTIEKRFRKISNSKKILVCITPQEVSTFGRFSNFIGGVFQMVSTVCILKFQVSQENIYDEKTDAE